jgi:rhodanese-related sulfurtransferase
MKNIIKSLLAIGLLCGLTTSYVIAEEMSKPSPKVQKLIEKFDLEVVDFDYTQNVVSKGTRKGAEALLIDARPNSIYLKGTIPSAINIPDTDFKNYYKQIEKADKTKEVIVFCGGWKCGKSPKVANMLKKEGFKNVKLYQAGEPEWKTKYYSEIGTPVIQSAQKKNDAFLIDARPFKKYLQSTIPGAISIPDTDMEKLLGKFPVDKDIKIITFCGGYDCGKSHKVAKKLLALGYKNVNVYAGGLPQWKKEGLRTTGSSKKIVEDTEVEKATFSKTGVKLGADEGTVDGEWLKKLILTNKVPANVQIVDVTATEDFGVAHIPGAVNVYAEKLSAKELVFKLPVHKAVIFTCASGARALEAWQKLKDAKLDVSNMFYFDANVNCDKMGNCKIEVNEPLG